MKKICLLILSFMCFVAQLMATNDVVITVLDKTKGASSLTFSQFPKFWINGPKRFDIKSIGEKRVLNDSIYTVIIQTTKPILVQCNWFGDRGSRMIITSGDRAKAIVEYAGNDKQKFEVHFSGKMNEDYNTYRDLKNRFNKNSIWNAIGTVSLQKSIKLIDSDYTSKCKIIKAVTKPGLIQDLMLNEEKTTTFYYLEHANNVSSNKLTWGELIKIKNKYFHSSISCENTIYMYDPEYNMGIRSLGDLLCRNIKSNNLLVAQTDTICKYFSGKLADYLIASCFHSFSRKSYNKMENISGPDVEKWYSQSLANMQDSESKALMQYSYDLYKKMNNPFPSAILNEKIIKLSDNSVLTFRDLLKKNEGSQVIIDTWASWCGSCIREIRRGKNNIKELESRGNHFIYLSIDKQEDINKAKEKAKALNILDKAYVIVGKAYKTYLDIISIPHYIMVDKNSNIKNMKLPYLSSIQNFDKYGE